ncbi:MAG: hypothetical protein KBS76_02150 [Ruminococcus sp.]|nr:hypothetical protein [Candidatus Apopatosoma intestinale]
MENDRSFTVRIAGKTIRIRPLYGRIARMCRDYTVPDRAPVDFTVCVTESDIADESRRQAASGKDKTPAAGDPAYLETLCVYRKIAEKMPDYGIVLCHAAAIARHGKAILFLAPSGVGKTTHIMNWKKAFSSEVTVINGDKPLMDLTSLSVCGTPWSGKEAMNENTSAPLGALCLLERGAENRITPIGFREALPGIIRQVYQPDDPAGLQTVLLMLERLKDVPCYRLACNMDVSSAVVAARGIFSAPTNENSKEKS